MNIEFLISTTNRLETQFLNKIFENIAMNNFNAIVINQCYQVEPKQLKSDNTHIDIHSVRDKGLSKSRNLALKNASRDICVVADDDLVYLKDCIERINQVYEEDKNLDVAVFQIITPDGEPYKRYSPNSYLIKKGKDQLKISSVEISFRLKSIKENGIEFNENLGLGAKYTKGEEAVFINECIRHGLKVKYFPIPIVYHPKESSGKTFSKPNIIANGIVYFKLFRFISPLVSLYFSIKKYSRYKRKYSFVNYLYLTLRGCYIGFLGI